MSDQDPAPAGVPANLLQRMRMQVDRAHAEATARDGGLVNVIGEIAALSVALSAKAEVLNLALQRPDLLIELLHVHADKGPAGAAVETTLRAEASDLALRLLAALRAGNADLLIVEEAFGHRVGSPDPWDVAHPFWTTPCEFKLFEPADVGAWRRIIAGLRRRAARRGGR